MLLRVLVVAILISIPAFCFSSEWSDGIGIYFDSAATNNCMSDGVGVIQNCFLVLENPSVASGIQGWQGTLTSDAGLLIFSFLPSGVMINVGQAPEYIVGLASPLAAEPLVVLATFDVLALSPGGLYFSGAGGVSFPYYISGDSPPVSVPMNLAFGGNGVPCAVINAPCPVENPTQEEGGESIGPISVDTSNGTGLESLIINSEGIVFSKEMTSWGNIKSCYR